MYHARVGVDTDRGLHTALIPLTLLALVISGSRVPSLFLAELGAAMSVASTRCRLSVAAPMLLSRSLTTATIWPGELVRFKPVVKAQDTRLAGYRVFATAQALEIAKQRHVVQWFFYWRVRQAEPLLEKIDTQYGLGCKGMLAVSTAGW